MKCPDCGNNVKRGKQGMRCACGYNFIFDPKADTRLTDGKFIALLRQSSNNGTYYFTPNQLWNRYCRKRGLGCLPVALVLTGLWIVGVAITLAVKAGGRDSLSLAHSILLFLAVPIPLFVIAAALRFYILPLGGRRRFDAFLERWQFARPVEHLITAPSLHEPPPDWIEADIYDYGVERILIVDRDLYVDWLVLNNFHAQASTLVLSASGYPGYLVPRAQSILNDHPETLVFLLHDATPEGMGLEPRLRTGNLLPLANRTVVDLGLTPADIKRLKGLRHLKPALSGYQLPLDMIGYPALAAGLAQALAQGVPLGALIEKAAAGDDGGSTGGFG